MSFHDERRRRPAPPRRRKSGAMRQRVAALGSLIVVLVGVGVIVHNSSRSSHVTASSTSSPTHGSSSGRSSSSRGRSTSSTTSPGTASVPILVYHVINTQPAQSTANPVLYVPADQFSAQMQALKASGWHAVTLNQLAANWTKGTKLGAGKPIVITFDNGYASHYANALPVLKRLGWPGVENLPVTGLPASDGGLADTQIRGLIAAGWELDTQGLTSTNLTSVDPSQVATQIASARQTLRSRYGVPVNWFSYPAGGYNAPVIAAVRAAGYLGATTMNPGWATARADRYRLPRLIVAGGTSAAQLLTQITAAKASTSVPLVSSGPGLT